MSSGNLKSLKERFDQPTSLVHPQAQHDWLNLRFQDCKYVTEYNFALHKIVSQLKLCKQTITNEDLIEKTLSTFHPNDLVFQQQYKNTKYTMHSELITDLLVAEKHRQLLMHNHNARPTGVAPVPEAHTVAQHSNNLRGRGQGRGPKRGGKGGASSSDSDQASHNITPAYQKMLQQEEGQKKKDSGQSSLPEANALILGNDDLLGEELADYGD
ncbi:PREDICTED: uncharacterized protein LOC109159927 [Ipomoea nil]|uniref:uncharacterized protein LOC109159927 n=1 Tax=Ipomoea nil TaxID=35883 RepID=UPI000901323B|nr:PREDICTED: uncharacterized protein LOC109159927 [Ipomoea nil]